MKWEKETGTDERRGGLCFFFISFKICRRQLQKPQLDSYNLHWRNSLIWCLFQTFHTRGLMSHYVCCWCTSECVLICSFLFLPACLCVFYSVSAFEIALSVSSVASWSIMAGCRTVQDGDMQSQRRRRFWLRKLLGVWTRLDSLSPFTAIIVLIGAFVSFTHLLDVTMGMFSACLIVNYPLCVSVGRSLSFCFLLNFLLFVSVSLPLPL